MMMTTRAPTPAAIPPNGTPCSSPPFYKSDLTVAWNFFISEKTLALASFTPSVQYSNAKVVLNDSFYGTAVRVKLSPLSTEYSVERDDELLSVVVFLVFSSVK